MKIKLTKTFCLTAALLCLASNAARAQEPDETPLPSLSGTRVVYETNPGTTAISYTGSNSKGEFTAVLTWAKNGEQSEMGGTYEVSLDPDMQGWWRVTHRISDGRFFYLKFKSPVQPFSWGGFLAKGNVFDQDGNPALRGPDPTPYTFEFENQTPEDETAPAIPQNPNPAPTKERGKTSLEWE